MNKTIYSAPEAEQIQVRLEENILSNVQRANVREAEEEGWSWSE